MNTLIVKQKIVSKIGYSFECEWECKLFISYHLFINDISLVINYLTIHYIFQNFL